MKQKDIEISVIEIEKNSKKYYYCQFNLLGDKHIVLTDSKRDAVLYTKKELGNALLDAEKIARTDNNTTLSIRQLSKAERKEFDYWF